MFTIPKWMLYVFLPTLARFVFGHNPVINNLTNELGSVATTRLKMLNLPDLLATFNVWFFQVQVLEI